MIGILAFLCFGLSFRPESGEAVDAGGQRCIYAYQVTRPAPWSIGRCYGRS